MVVRLNKSLKPKKINNRPRHTYFHSYVISIVHILISKSISQLMYKEFTQF